MFLVIAEKRINLAVGGACLPLDLPHVSGRRRRCLIRHPADGQVKQPASGQAKEPDDGRVKQPQRDAIFLQVISSYVWQHTEENLWVLNLAGVNWYNGLYQCVSKIF